MSNDMIIMEGNLVKFVRQDVHSVVLVDDFIRGLTGKLAILSPIFAQNGFVRMGFKNQKEYYVYKLPSKVRKIVQVTNEENSEGEIVTKRRHYTISVPPTLFLFRVQNSIIEDTIIRWLDSDNLTQESKVYKTLMPNIHDNGSICFGDTQQGTIKLSEGNIIEQMDKLANSFYDSTFNDDLASLAYDFSAWNNSTSKDPEFWKTLIKDMPRVVCMFKDFV